MTADLRDNGASGTSVVATCLCLKLRMVARTTASLYDAAVSPVGLNSAQFSTLRNIYRFLPSGMSELSKVMLVQRTTLARNLEVLRERGLIELAASSTDSRLMAPSLTRQGTSVLKEAVPRWQVVQRRFLGGMGAAGWADLLSALRAAAAVNEQLPQRLHVLDVVPGQDVFEDMAELDALDAQRCANSTLQGAARWVTREYDGALRKLGVRTTQLHVLAAIHENPRHRPVDLARLLSLDQASIALTLAGMRREGWVGAMWKDRSGGASNASGSVPLTAGGRAILRAARPAWAKVQSDKTRRGPDQALLRWCSAIDGALMAALKARSPDGRPVPNRKRRDSVDRIPAHAPRTARCSS